VVEEDQGRAERLAVLLDRLFKALGPSTGGAGIMRTSPSTEERFRSIGYDSQSKPHVFVAMPFAETMDDVFYYGIQGPVKAAGFLCERADLSTFTGDVIDWVKHRIDSASLVIAELSDANPNVYLEVGYAWGRARPTVLLVRDASQLKFDVRGQRCLVYRKIKDLEDSLRTELDNLKGSVRHYADRM
jgi:hypothetical protein